MRVLSAITKFLAWVIVLLGAVAALACVAVYVPWVQQFAARRATVILAEKTGMQVSVERFRVRFPLGVSLRGATVVSAAGDTLLTARRVTTNVAFSLRRLRQRDIRVRRLTVDGAFLRVPSSAPDTLAAPLSDTLIPVVDWGVSVGSLRVSDSRLTASGLDFRDFSAEIRDVVFDRGEASVDVRALRFREAAHGVMLENASGGLSFQDGEYKINNFALKTARSSLRLTASAGASIARLAPSTAVSVDADGTISGEELSPRSPFSIFNFQFSIQGSLADLTVSRLEFDAPEHAKISASGTVQNALTPTLIAGSLTVEAEVEDSSAARRFLPDSVRFGLPRALSLAAEGDFSASAFDLSHLAIAAENGTLDARGRLDLKAKTYAAELRTRDFPLGAFLPADSLGRATLTANVSGRGFDPEGGIRARADASVQRFDWKSYDLRGVTLAAEVDGEAFKIDLASDNDLLRTTLAASGALAKDRTEASVRTGDLALDFASPLPVGRLVEASQNIDREVRRQLRARHFSADSLQRAFPEIRLTARAGRQNVLSELARARGVDFADVTADVATVPGIPFNIRARATRFVAGKVILDTIALDARRRDSLLDYSLRMAGRRSRSELVGDHLGLIVVDGSVGGNELTVNVLQQNQSHQTGFRFGAVAALRDSTVHLRMTPLDPVLAYERWTVDGAGMGGDWLEIGLNGALQADLQLTGDAPGKYINLSSAHLADTPEALRLDAAGLDIAAALELFPTMPQTFGGLFFSGATFGLLRGEQKNIVAAGSLGVENFTYSGRRIADVEAAVDFQTGASGAMELRADLLLDRAASLSARGTYRGETMDFAVRVPGLPLKLADGFVPPEVGARLSGTLDGEIAIKGTAKDPRLSGEMGFTDASARIGMTGTTLKISPERVTVDGRKINFNDIGLIAPNNQKLTLSGALDFTDMTHPRADAAIKARNFQLVNSQHIGGSQLYGTAATDINITARGPLQRLLVRGNINPTASTNFVYIMRNNSRVQDRRQHIVEFLRFADDSLYAAPEEAFAGLKPRVDVLVDVLVGVRMGEGLKATLSLDEQNENRVELIGGGDLTFSMNPQGDVRLSGRYELSGGTVYYRPPMIAQKVFAVERGSYVEWRGSASAPEFHISATQRMEVEVTYDEAYSEQVAFDVSVDISGTLGRMDMRFDLAAPGNLAIHNQLLSMDAEERMRQALGLLLYGQYTGPGVSSRGASFDARQQLADFISRELNQWARNNLKGVDFSMGIARRTDGVTGDAHTDYKYSVSKSLFSDRVRVSVGGRVSDERTEQSSVNDLLEDVSLEYRINRRGTMQLRLYRLNTRESILEGEVTETGAGFVMRRKINRLGDIFRNRRRNEIRN